MCLNTLFGIWRYWFTENAFPDGDISEEPVFSQEVFILFFTSFFCGERSMIVLLIIVFVFLLFYHRLSPPRCCCCCLFHSEKKKIFSFCFCCSSSSLSSSVLLVLVDTEAEVPAAVRAELSKVPSVHTWLGQNMALLVLPTAYWQAFC